MSKKRFLSPAGLIGCLSGMALFAAAETTARAEIDVDFFGGAHWSSDNNGLGRGSYPNTSGPPSQASGYNTSGMFGLRLGYLPIERLTIEAELGLVPTATHGPPNSAAATAFTPPSVNAAILAVRAHLLFNILTGRVRPFVLLGGGGQISLPAGTSYIKTDGEGEFHAGVGLKIDITKNKWGIRLDGRAIFPPGISSTLTNEWEALASFYGRFGVGPAAPLPQVITAEDSDGDGVPNSEDKCPTVAGPKDNGGCPDTDRDGDGVVDRLDKCPDKPGLKEFAGCPEPDRDRDGIADAQDKCPEQAGPRENGGCPDSDRDNDGIVNRLDKCPDQPETKNGYQDEDGCPDEVPQALAKFTGTIKGINFGFGNAIINKSSHKVLDEAVAVLKEHDSVRLEISGHTDNTGKPEANREISQDRANAVRQYMIDKGIDGSRLVAMGFGPDKPIADNNTSAGRAENRRVEFKLISK